MTLTPSTTADKVPMPESAMRLAPLCVDLDGTLLKTDTLHELLVLLVRKRPLLLLRLPLWLMKGKAYFKTAVADRIDLDVETLPYSQKVVRYLRREHRQGRRIVLATGAAAPLAQKIAEHLGVFSCVIATRDAENMTGKLKLARLREEIGQRDFVYAGNSNIDFAIWRGSKYAILVNASRRLVRRTEKVAEIVQQIEDREPVVRTLVRSIRLHQWAKNLLVFVPLVAGHYFTDSVRVFEAGMAFLAFGLCASGVYLINDLCDLESDRKHPTKKDRPLAAGNMQVKDAVVAIPVLWGAAFALSLTMLNLSFTLVLAVYLALTLVYSTWLKKVVLVDVFLLAVLYTLRMIGGSAATEIVLSNWLMLFSLFTFLSLAFLKRFTEMQRIGEAIEESRGYQVVDLDQLAMMGAASGYITAMVIALYISSEEVTVLYTRPQVLWAICPLLLYWVSRNWILARRGEMDDDPVVFAVRDRVTLAIGLLAAVVFVIAM